MDLQLQAVVLNGSGDTLPNRVTWSSSNPSKVAVDLYGRVMGVDAGSAVITASTGSLEKSVSIVVVRLATYAWTPTITTLQAGEVDTFHVTGYDARRCRLPEPSARLELRYPVFATVTNEGIVTAKETDGGSFRIILTLGHLTGQIPLTVAPAPVASVHFLLPTSTDSLWSRQTIQVWYQLFSAGGSLSHGRTVLWSSSDNTVATVSADGLVAKSSIRPCRYQVGSGGDNWRSPAGFRGIACLQPLAAQGRPCAVGVAGEVYCWNSDGVPEREPGSISFVSLSADQQLCGLTADGSAYRWKANGSGEVGDGTTTDRDSPTPVAGGLAFRQSQRRRELYLWPDLRRRGILLGLKREWSTGNRGFPPAAHAFCRTRQPHILLDRDQCQRPHDLWCHEHEPGLLLGQ